MGSLGFGNKEGGSKLWIIIIGEWKLKNYLTKSKRAKEEKRDEHLELFQLRRLPSQNLAISYSNNLRQVHEDWNGLNYSTLIPDLG